MTKAQRTGLAARFVAGGLVWPTLLSILGLVVLVGLGVWQLQRMTWKNSLIAAIETRVVREPVALSEVMKRWQTLKGDVDYTRAWVSGEFQHDKERFYYAPHPRLGPGYHVYTPLRLADPSGKVLWINRGYLPRGKRARNARANGLPAGEVKVTGLVRLAGLQGMFSPDNDVAGNTWYWRDLAAMHASAYEEAETSPLPFFLDAEAQPGQKAGIWPKGGVTDINLPNKHFGYALTWLGLAMTLLGVYVAFALSRLRQQGT